MKSFLLYTLLLVVGFNSFAQSDKKLQKSIDQYATDPQGAIERLKKYIDAEEMARPEAWDLYVEMFSNMYQTAKQYYASPEVQQNIQNQVQVLERKYDDILIVKEDWDSSRVEFTELEYELMLKDLQIVQNEYNQLMYDQGSYGELENLINACREATLKGRSAQGDGVIRNTFLDHDPDTAYLDSSAYVLSNEIYYWVNNGLAAQIKPVLDSALREHPKSYNFNMCKYLYFSSLSNTDSAIVYLKKTVELFPDLTIPRENLAQALFSSGNVYRARAQIMEILVRYPGEDIKAYYREILFIENAELVENRLIRQVYPNKPGMKQGTANSLWEPYQKAILKVGGFTSAEGIIKDNDITPEKYLEVYSWVQMLDWHKKDKPEELAFAYEMQEKGYLDCYVFFSNFHMDFGDQMIDFAKSEENRERMKTYIKDFCVEKIGRE